MRERIGRWGFVLLLVVGLGLLPARPAGAQTAVLPPFKPAFPSRFTLTGRIVVGPQALKIGADGAQAQDLFQQDFSATPEQGVGVLSLSMIQVGQTFYFKFPQTPAWQMIDLTQLPGGVPNIQSSIPNLNGFTPNGGLRTYEAARSSQLLGKATLDGVATTEYQADVDVAKLFASIGTPAAQAAQAAAVSKMTLYLWIGDADGVLHQQRVVLNSKAAAPGGALVDVLVDFTIAYRDIGAAVTIMAPPNAVPYQPAPPNPAPGGPAPAPPTPAPTATPPSQPAPGMPTTGAADPAGALALLGLGLLCLLVGGRARRAARPSR